MSRVLVAKKILGKMNQLGIFIFIIIAFINIFGSAIIFALFDGENFIGKLLFLGVTNGGIYIFIVMVIISIKMAYDGVDYLISIGMERKNIFHAIMGIIMKFTIVLTIFIVILIALNANYGYGTMEKMIILGMRGSDFNALSYGLLFLYLSIVGYFVMVYMMFIVLLAKRYGWYYLVGTLLLTLSLTIIWFNDIRLLLIIGTWIPVTFVGLTIVNIVLTFMNKMLIQKVEFRR